MFRVLPYGLFQSRTNLERDGPLQFEQRNQLVDLLKRSKLRPERSNVHIFGKNTDPSVLLVVGYLGSTGFIADNLRKSFTSIGGGTRMYSCLGLGIL